MTLHDAIIQVLREEKRSLGLAEIAEIINQKKLYSRKKDNQPLQAFQVRLRVIHKNYRHLFICENDKVRLNEDVNE
ncbi:HTH domain-containing protein [Fundicoccus sp. Sow4_D5]|uniref:HTH domain-containing protein n=1 Tax=Fundicoccus sp. Sow4_D5 TaxID=3438782 RepID=UPI003F906D5F